MARGAGHRAGLGRRSPRRMHGRAGQRRHRHRREPGPGPSAPRASGCVAPSTSSWPPIASTCCAGSSWPPATESETAALDRLVEVQRDDFAELLRVDGRSDGHRAAAGSTPPRVPAGPRRPRTRRRRRPARRRRAGAAGRGSALARARSRCWGRVVSVWPCSSPRSTRCRSGRSWPPPPRWRPRAAHPVPGSSSPWCRRRPSWPWSGAGSIREAGPGDGALPVGAMIETPRAALVAGDLARAADFLSFGTNDLTQLAFGLSRDDAGRILDAYRSQGLLADDPFATLDDQGVGALVRLGVEAARSARPEISLGVCGEHGGDPASIERFLAAGLDSVSCSPVPGAGGPTGRGPGPGVAGRSEPWPGPAANVVARWYRHLDGDRRRGRGAGPRSLRHGGRGQRARAAQAGGPGLVGAVPVPQREVGRR